MSDVPRDGTDDDEPGADSGGAGPADESPPPSEPAGSGGRPAGGSPPPQPGGQPPGGAPGQRGPGIGDIFSMPRTQAELKHGLTLFGAIGVGVAIAGLLAPILQGVGGTLSSGVLFGSFALGPGLGVLLAHRQDEELEDLATNLAAANAAATAGLGTLLLGFIAFVGAAAGTSLASVGAGGVGFAFQAVIIQLLAIAVGAAVTGGGYVWAIRGPLGEAPSTAPGGAQPGDAGPPQ